jgi:NAD(P)-dependent dehydrogenase (short-subunit alcohol dehydrogenase family)
MRLAQLGATVALRAARQPWKTPPTDSNSGRKPESIKKVKGVIERELGIPPILINAAGVFGPIDLVRDGDPGAWIETVMISAVSPYLTCRTFVGGMIDGGCGRIVNVTSAAALHEPGPVNNAYGTCKVALN